MRPFTFVVGCGRSGTTLVQAMLDSHPDLAVAHEARFAAALGAQRARYETRDGVDVDALVADLLPSPNFRSMRLPEDDVRAVLVAPPRPSDFPAAVRRIFELFARRQGKERYGDKTPGYVARIPLLASLFPEARFVHVIRDGRDVALAYLDRGWGPDSVAAAALDWRSRITRGRAAGRRLGPSAYCEVRYEDVVGEPEEALRPVCAFLDLAYDPGMLRYVERSAELVATTKRPERFEGLTKPPTAGMRDWRTQMARDDVRLYEAVAGRALAAFGYETAGGVGIGDRARATRAWGAWQTRRARRLLPSLRG